MTKTTRSIPRHLTIAVFSDVCLNVAGGIASSIFTQKAALEKTGHKVIVFAPGWHAKLAPNPLHPDFPKLPCAVINKKTDPTIVVVPTAKYLKPGNAPLARWPKTVINFILRNFPEFQTDFNLVHVHYEAGCSIAGVLLAQTFHLPLVQTMHGREDMAIQTNLPLFTKTFTAALLNRLHARYLPHPIKITKNHTPNIRALHSNHITIVNYPRPISGPDNLAPTRARAHMWELMINHANAADAVITPSKHFAAKLRRYGVTRAIHPIPNGIDDQILKTKIKIRELSPGAPLKLFWNSRVSYEKRILPFLQTLSLVEFPFQLIVCGDGNAFCEAKKFAKSHDLNVKFLGSQPRDEIWNLMRDQHLSITVSYGFDTQGMTLIEAEAVGLPVFYCDPDMREVVPKSGAVFSGPSTFEMAEALNRLYANPQKIAAMSQAMLNHRQELAVSIQIEHTLKLYDKLFGQF